MTAQTLDVVAAAKPRAFEHPKRVQDDGRKPPKRDLMQTVCAAHDDCEDDEYCDNRGYCYACSICDSFDDSITGSCPECSGDDSDDTDDDTGDDDDDDIDPATVLCFLSNGGPCLAGLFDQSFDAVGDAESAADAVTALGAFCENCTAATSEFEDVFTACNIADDDAIGQMLALFAELLDNSCADIECAAHTLWSFEDLDERQDTFCEYRDCGVEIVSPLLEMVLDNSEDGDSAISLECVTGTFDLTCLADDNSGGYCLAELENLFEGDDGVTSVAPFCESSCSTDLTRTLAELDDAECGLDALTDITPDCDQLDYEFTLLDFCTVNEDEEYCVDFLVNEATSDVDCDVDVDLVPSPGPDSGNDTSLCPAECTQAFEDYVETLGCCALWSLDISCASDQVRDFVTDDCGVELGAQCDRPEIPVVVVVAASAPVLRAALTITSVITAASVASLL